MGLAPAADVAQAIADLNSKIGIPASLSAIGVCEEHFAPNLDYALTDLATATNAIPFDAAKYEDLFRRSL
jgi:hypothetical protein